MAAEAKVERLERDIESISANLASTYEEISLLYDLIRHLRISSSEEELADVALSWLYEYLPAESVAIQYLPVADDGSVTYKARTETVWLAHGKSPVDSDGFSNLVRWLRLHATSEPYVANAVVTGQPSWPFPRVREVIVTPLSEGDNLLAWLVAFNDGLFTGTAVEELPAIWQRLREGVEGSGLDLVSPRADWSAAVRRWLAANAEAKAPAVGQERP